MICMYKDLLQFMSFPTTFNSFQNCCTSSLFFLGFCKIVSVLLTQSDINDTWLILMKKLSSITWYGCLCLKIQREIVGIQLFQLKLKIIWNIWFEHLWSIWFSSVSHPINKKWTHKAILRTQYSLLSVQAMNFEFHFDLHRIIRIILTRLIKIKVFYYLTI